MRSVILLFTLFFSQFLLAQYTGNVKFSIAFGDSVSYPANCEFYLLSGSAQSFSNCSYNRFNIVDTSKEFITISGDYKYVGGFDHSLIIAISIINKHPISGEILRKNFYIQLIGFTPKFIDSHLTLELLDLPLKLNYKTPFIRYSIVNEKIEIEYYETYLVTEKDNFFANKLMYSLDNWTPIERKR